MKTSIKYLATVILTIALSFSIHSLTFAQHRGGGGGGGFHGGGGGGFHGGGGGGFHSSGGGGFHSSGGNRGSYSGGQRPAVRTQSTQSRPQVNSTSRSYSGTQRTVAPNYVTRGGAQRGYAGSVSAYSGRGGYRGGGVYRGGAYRGGRGYYGGYSRFYAPRIGFRVNILPYGYYPFYWGDDQFYYDNGLFYQQAEGQTDNTQYEVVAPPMGAIVPTVPQGAKTITIDGLQYYEADGVYYQPVTTSDGTTGYKIVGKDGELNTDQNNGGDSSQDNNNNNAPDNGTAQPDNNAQPAN